MGRPSQTPLKVTGANSAEDDSNSSSPKNDDRIIEEADPEEKVRKPVKDFNHRHKADSEAESTNATNVGDKVQPSHLPRSLKLWSSSHE